MPQPDPIAEASPQRTGGGDPSPPGNRWGREIAPLALALLPALLIWVWLTAACEDPVIAAILTGICTVLLLSFQAGRTRE